MQRIARNAPFRPSSVEKLVESSKRWWEEGRGKLKRPSTLEIREGRGGKTFLGNNSSSAEEKRFLAFLEIGPARLFAKSSVKRGVIVNARGFCRGKGGGRRD